MDYVSTLLPGLGQSLKLTVAVLLVGLPAGLLGGLAMGSSPRPVQLLVWGLTEIGRGFPALITLYLAYFGLPTLGVTLGSFAAVTVAFGFTTASYTADIFRAAIASIPHSQSEAGSALGLSRSRVMWGIIMPQALRQVILPIGAFCIIIFQGTSLAYSIGEKELLSQAYSQGTLEFNIVPYLLAASALYLGVVLAFQLVVNLSLHRPVPIILLRKPSFRKAQSIHS